MKDQNPNLSLLLAGLLIAVLMTHSTLLAADTDSLRLRLYSGLDEIGTGGDFYTSIKKELYTTSWKGKINSLFRRPRGSFGELKSNGFLNGSVSRDLRSNLALKMVLDSDFYRLERFSGPAPYMSGFQSELKDFELATSAATSTLPPQGIDRLFVGAGSTFKPDSLLTLTSIIGHQWESREGFNDRGVAVTLEAELQNFEYSGYHNRFDAYLEQAELGNRTNRDLKFEYGLAKQFSPLSSDQLAIRYRQKRFDYHIWGSPDIGTRIDTDQSLQNQLLYNISSQIGFVLDNELVGSTSEDRTPVANNVRDEIRTANALTFNTNHKTISSWTRFKFDWGAQEDVTGLKHERGISLENNFIWQPLDGDSLALFSAVRKRQYDTSDTSNYDDRDRLRYEVVLAYQKLLPFNVKATLKAETALEHLVYIYAEKSDQNHWNRIFKLNPEVSFEPFHYWHNLSSFELVTNSTDYDFELDPVNIKSTIYRRYSATDSLAWAFHPRWNISWEYTLTLEDGGRFIWDDWIEQISEEYRTHQVAVVMGRRSPSGFHFDIGASYYDRKGWEYDMGPAGESIKTPFFYLTRWGPFIQVDYPSESSVTVVANSDLSWVHEWNQEDYVIINLDLRIVWR